MTERKEVHFLPFPKVFEINDELQAGFELGVPIRFSVPISIYYTSLSPINLYFQ